MWIEALAIVFAICLRSATEDNVAVFSFTSLTILGVLQVPCIIVLHQYTAYIEIAYTLFDSGINDLNQCLD